MLLVAFTEVDIHFRGFWVEPNFVGTCLLQCQCDVKYRRNITDCHDLWLAKNKADVHDGITIIARRGDHEWSPIQVSIKINCCQTDVGGHSSSHRDTAVKSPTATLLGVTTQKTATWTTRHSNVYTVLTTHSSWQPVIFLYKPANTSSPPWIRRQQVPPKRR